MALDKITLKRMMPFATQANIDKFIDPLNAAMLAHGINTPLRIAAFIAQIAHESGSLRYVKEIASGAAYENRHDLGNIKPGDGMKFKGRGLIQVTGRANYQAVSDSFGVDFISHPEYLKLPAYCAMSAGWFWTKHNLNKFADEGNIAQITKIINGGLNGWKERLSNYELAKKVLSI